MTRRQSPSCASDLRLDQLLAGELSALDAEGLQAHVAECAPCRARHLALELEHREQSERLPAFAELGLRAGLGELAAPMGDGRAEPAEPAEPDAPRRRTRAGVWLAVGSLAAAVALWTSSAERLDPESVTTGEPRRSAPDTRTKGGGEVQLEWAVRREGEVLAPAATEPLHPRDALRFWVRADRAGRVAVFSLDGADQVSVYHDWVPLDAGERQLLPGAVELDDVVGEEHLYAMVCERAVPRAQVEAAIRKDRVRPELPADCSVDHHIVRKEPR